MKKLIVVMMGSLGILAGVAVIWMAMQSRRQIREMEHRERLAMIERGLVPAPEVDPAAFERKFGARRARPGIAGAVRARSGGVIMIALGLAFMFDDCRSPQANPASASASAAHSPWSAPASCSTRS